MLMEQFRFYEILVIFAYT